MIESQIERAIIANKTKNKGGLGLDTKAKYNQAASVYNSDFVEGQDKKFVKAKRRMAGKSIGNKPASSKVRMESDLSPSEFSAIKGRQTFASNFQFSYKDSDFLIPEEVGEEDERDDSGEFTLNPPSKTLPGSSLGRNNTIDRTYDLNSF